MTALAFLLLSVVCLLMQAISEWRARRRESLIHEEHVATIYARSGRLVWRRRRA